MSGSASLVSASWLNIGLRLLGSIAIGALVGWERQVRHKPAGLMTSADAIRASAALGVAVGCGLWQLGLLRALLTFLVLWTVKWIEPKDD
jgi:putative Mg2+ transporter-C (MgtC) family protein